MSLSHACQYLYIDDPNIQLFCDVCGDEMFCCDYHIRKIKEDYGVLACVKCRDKKIPKTDARVETDNILSLTKISTNDIPNMVEKLLDVYSTTKNIKTRDEMKSILALLENIRKKLDLFLLGNGEQSP
jgi:hypothetical protein